ncbi:hypothetical protein NDU88_008100, partial [Pleurodeles waltl]
LDKELTSIKKMFSGGLFAMAGCYRGRMPGHGTFQASSGYPSVQGSYQSSPTFYPTRSRRGCAQAYRGGNRSSFKVTDAAQQVRVNPFSEVILGGRIQWHL